MEFSGKIIPTMCEPIAIYSLPPGLHKKYKQLIVDIASSRNSLDNELVRPGVGAYEDITFICSRKHQSVFRQFEQLESLEKIISSLILQYVGQLGYICDEVFLSNAWINHSKKGATLGMHMHRNSFFSGTYYVNYDPSVHCPIAFQNSRLNSIMQSPGISLAKDPRKSTPYNMKYLSLPYKEGDILIWLSHVVHGYSVPSKGDDRIVLGFNAMPRECTESGDIFGFTASPCY